MDEVKKDQKIDFYEFIIVSYLRPAFKDIPVKFRSFNKKDLIFEIEIFTDFALKVSKLKTISAELGLKCLKPADKKNKLSYLKISPILDKLRFADILVKEDIISDLNLIFHYDDVISKREDLLLRLIHQTLAIPTQKS